MWIQWATLSTSIIGFLGLIAGIIPYLNNTNKISDTNKLVTWISLGLLLLSILLLIGDIFMSV